MCSLNSSLDQLATGYAYAATANNECWYVQSQDATALKVTSTNMQQAPRIRPCV